MAPRRPKIEQNSQESFKIDEEVKSVQTLLVFVCVWLHLGSSWERLGAVLGRLGAFLGSLGAVLGPSWAILRKKSGEDERRWLQEAKMHKKYLKTISCFRCLASSWAVLGTSWSHLGPSWGRLGPYCGRSQEKMSEDGFKSLKCTKV